MSIISNDLKRLVIVDDGDLVYRMYKNNTIKVEEWTKAKKNDNELQEIIEILE